MISEYKARPSTSFHPTLQTALLKIVNDLLLALDDENNSLLALLDLSAAFDTIDHCILLHRLHRDFGIQGTTLDWFSSYFTNRTQLSASAATHPSQLPSLSVFHRDQSLDLSFSFSIQLLFLLQLKSSPSFITHTLTTLSSKSLHPLIKSLTSSCLCRNVLMTLNPG